jgi:hypothetical protein
MVAGAAFVAYYRSGSSTSTGAATSSAAAGRAPADAASNQAGAAPRTAPRASGVAGPAAIAASGYNLTASNAGRHARDLVAGRVRGTQRVTFASDGSVAVSPTAAATEAAAGSAAGTLLTPDLQGCYLSLITQFGGSVRGVDLVTYGGMQALTVVLSVPDSPDLLRIAVLDPRCGEMSVAASLRFATLSAAR